MSMRTPLTLVAVCLSQLWTVAPATGQPDASRVHDGIALFEERVSRRGAGASDLALLGDLYLRRARTTGDLGDVARAEDLARASLAALPGYPLAESILIRALSDQHRFDEARELAAARLALDPTDAATALALGDALLELGDVERAEDIFLALKDRGPAVTARLAKVSLQRNTDEAIELARQALDRARAVHAPDADWYGVFLADILFDEGRFDEADALLAEVRERSPELPVGLSVTAELHSARGNDPQALYYLGRLATLRPADPLVATAIGDALARLGDMRRSRDAYLLAERLFADAVKRMAGIYDRQLALFYADRGVHLAEALELARKELARRESPESLAAVGWVLYQQGDVDEAVSLMDRAVETDVRDLDIYYRASQVFRAAGRKDAADRYLAVAHRWSPHLFPTR